VVALVGCFFPYGICLPTRCTVTYSQLTSEISLGECFDMIHRICLMKPDDRRLDIGSYAPNNTGQVWWGPLPALIIPTPLPLPINLLA